MRNHYHLVLQSSEQHLCALMRPLNGRYAQTFSKIHNRRGYLFQDRYKSVVTQDQNYVEELIRYVHANPLRAGICASMDELDVYPWTGHAGSRGIWGVHTLRCPLPPDREKKSRNQSSSLKC